MLFLHTSIHHVSLLSVHISRITNLSSYLSYQTVFSLPLARYIGKADSITISVWNHKKIHKKQGAGFLGCVRLLSNAINRLKDTGCRYLCTQVCTMTVFIYLKYSKIFVHKPTSNSLQGWSRGDCPKAYFLGGKENHT